MKDSKSAGSPGIADNPLIPQLKNAGIVFGWIAGLVLIAGLLWFFTQPVRNRFLVRAANLVLEQSGDYRRLGETALSSKASGSFVSGSWFSVIPAAQAGYSADLQSGRGRLPGGTKAFVFTLIGEGYFFPCLAIVSPQGKVEEFIPLGIHGERMMKRVSAGLLRIYSRRIEGGES